jgi:hypothetical protein
LDDVATDDGLDEHDRGRHYVQVGRAMAGGRASLR